MCFSEYNFNLNDPANPVATAVRFCTDVLSAAPSIVIGVVAYVLIVQRTRQFSGSAPSTRLNSVAARSGSPFSR